MVCTHPGFKGAKVASTAKWQSHCRALCSHSADHHAAPPTLVQNKTWQNIARAGRTAVAAQQGRAIWRTTTASLGKNAAGRQGIFVSRVCFHAGCLCSAEAGWLQDPLMGAPHAAGQHSQHSFLPASTSCALTTVQMPTTAHPPCPPRPAGTMTSSHWRTPRLRGGACWMPGQSPAHCCSFPPLCAPSGTPDTSPVRGPHDFVVG